MDFLQPRRQHPLGVLILAAQFLWRFGQQAWPLLIGVSFGDNALRNILLGGTGFLILTGAYALIYYLRFQYSVEGEVLVVQKGVIQRERLQVPFERIQTIQLFQGPIQQVFGLTGLRVDTAGSSGSELQLVAIRKEAAEALQFILRRQSKDLTSEQEGGHPSGEVEEETASVASPATPLVSLSLGALLKVGLSQNHLRNAFAGFALISYIIGNQPEAISAWLDSVPALLAPLLGLAFLLLILPGIVLFLMSGVVVSMATAVLKYYGMTSSIGEEGLHAEMGLLRRNTFQVPFDRIHLTLWRSNWIRRKLGFETLEVRQAQAQSGTTGGVKVMLPAIGPTHRAILEAELYPDLITPPIRTLKPVRRMRWILWGFAILPAGLLWLSWGPWSAGMATALWVGFTGWTTARRFASLQLTVHQDTVVIEKGWFWRRRILLKLSQLQGVEWERKVFLERRSIGHLVFHTAAGARRFPYLRREEGEAIRDFALNQHHAGSRRA